MLHKRTLPQKVAPPEGEPVEAMVDAYLVDCQARGLSPRTVSQYTYALRGELLPFCRREGIDTVDGLQRQLLQRLNVKFLDEGGAKGPLSRNSVNTYLRAINHFLAWLEREGADVARAERVRVKSAARAKEVLTSAECQQLEAAAAGERDRLVIRTLVETGCRETELAELRVDGVVRRMTEQGPAFWIRIPEEGKTGYRTTSISEDLHSRLVHYRDHLRPAQAGTDRLFVALRRRRAGRGHDPLTRSGVYQIVRDAWRRAGIPKRIYPHLLRSTRITQLCLERIDPVIIQQETGVSLRTISEHYMFAPEGDRWRAVMEPRAHRDEPPPPLSLRRPR